MPCMGGSGSLKNNTGVENQNNNSSYARDPRPSPVLSKLGSAACYKGRRGKWRQLPLGENESFHRETNNLQFKCIRDQAVPPHMQIDANDMQMGQSKPGFASGLCQAVT